MCDSCGGQTHDGECTLNLDGDILTPIICMLCGELQVFEFEFKKIRAGNRADSGRCSDTKHIFLTAPTCSEPMICGVCGYEGALAPDNHASNNFAYQSTGAFSHSIICLDCEAVIDEHDGVIDGWCEICQAYVLEE